MHQNHNRRTLKNNPVFPPTSIFLSKWECALQYVTKYALLVSQNLQFPGHSHLITRLKYIKQKKNSMDGGGRLYKWHNISHPWKPSQSVNPKTLRKSNDLLAVLHTSLHAHRVSLRARGPIALAWVSRALLGPWRRPLMGLLGVRPTWPIRLTAHFPHLIHGTWSLWNESDKEVWAKVTRR